MKRALVLYRLQQLDLNLEKASRRRSEVLTGIGESVDLKRARKAVADAQAHMAKCRATSRDIDLEVRGVIQRIQANEQKLYGGSVANPKELANLQNDTHALKRFQEKREQDLLEAMVREEEAETALANAEKRLEQVSAKWERDQAALVQERDQLDATLSESKDGRSELSANLSEEDKKTYDFLRQKKGGRAVAIIQDGLCQGCRMSPPTNQVKQASVGDELVFCGNCGRILYAP